MVTDVIASLVSSPNDKVQDDSKLLSETPIII
jgi:hypothetical protein